MRAKRVSDPLSNPIEEGVADKFMSSKFAVPDEFDEFEKTYARQQRKRDENVVWTDPNIKGWQIIKNPSSLKILAKGVRGVISPNGDLYMENFSKGTIHNYILEILYKIGELEGKKPNGWSKLTPQESGFLTVQRFKDTDYICIGESNSVIYKEDDWRRLLPQYEEFLNRARKKNPELNISNKLVGVKYPWLADQKHIKEGFGPENMIRSLLRDTSE